MLHGVFAEPGTTRILTVALSQHRCCCLWESSLTLKQEFPAPPSCPPACGVSVTLLGLEQEDYSTAHGHPENGDALRPSYHLAI